jgi:hypothetical protein
VHPAEGAEAVGPPTNHRQTVPARPGEVPAVAAHAWGELDGSVATFKLSE